MSLLMEALRKAEEAKRKDKKDTGADSIVDDAYPVHPENDNELSGDSAEEADLDSDPSLEEAPESKNLQVEFDAAIAQDPNFEAKSHSGSEAEEQAEGGVDESAEETPDSSGQTQWSDLDLHPMAVESKSSEPSLASDTEPEQKTSVGLSVSDLDAASVSTATTDTDSSSEDLSDTHLDEAQSEESEASPRVLIDDADPFEEEAHDHDPIETAAWQSRARRLVNPTRYNRYLLLLILLLPLGGLLYWWFAPEDAPVTATASQDRGFLGQTPDEALAGEQAIQGNTDQTLTASDNIEGNGVSAVEVTSGNSESFIIGEDLEVALEDPVQIQPVSTIAQIEQRNTFQITPVSPSIGADLAGNIEAAQSSDRTDAREYYENILAEQPNNTDALLGLARLDINEGNSDSARSIYRLLQQLNPQDPLAQAGLLQVDLAADLLSQEAELKSLVDKNPEIAPLSFALGNLFASQRRWNEAEGAYNNALVSAKTLEGNSIHPDYAFNLAVTLEQLNQQHEALTYYKEALDLSEHYTPSFDLNVLNSRIDYLGRVL